MRPQPLRAVTIEIVRWVPQVMVTRLQQRHGHTSRANQSDPGQACRLPHIAAQATLQQKKIQQKHLLRRLFSAFNSCKVMIRHTRRSAASDRFQSSLCVSDHLIPISWSTLLHLLTPCCCLHSILVPLPTFLSNSGNTHHRCFFGQSPAEFGSPPFQSLSKPSIPTCWFVPVAPIESASITRRQLFALGTRSFT